MSSPTNPGPLPPFYKENRVTITEVKPGDDVHKTHLRLMCGRPLSATPREEAYHSYATGPPAYAAKRYRNQHIKKWKDIGGATVVTRYGENSKVIFYTPDGRFMTMTQPAAQPMEFYTLATKRNSIFVDFFHNYRRFYEYDLGKETTKQHFLAVGIYRRSKPSIMVPFEPHGLFLTLCLVMEGRISAYTTYDPRSLKSCHYGTDAIPSHCAKISDYAFISVAGNSYENPVMEYDIRRLDMRVNSVILPRVPGDPKIIGMCYDDDRHVVVTTVTHEFPLVGRGARVFVGQRPPSQKFIPPENRIRKIHAGTGKVAWDIPHFLNAKSNATISVHRPKPNMAQAAELDDQDERVGWLLERWTGGGGLCAPRSFGPAGGN